MPRDSNVEFATIRDNYDLSISMQLGELLKLNTNQIWKKLREPRGWEKAEYISQSKGEGRGRAPEIKA